MKYLLFLMLMLSGVVHAATILTITHDRPTTYSDGSALPADVPLTYRYYIGECGVNPLTPQEAWDGGASFDITDLKHGSYTAFATAVADGVESNCGSASFVLLPKTPSRPENIIIQVE